MESDPPALPCRAGRNVTGSFRHTARRLAVFRFMARVVGVLAALAVGLLNGCSPGTNAAIGIGYDTQGRLVGAVRVCEGSAVRVHLAPTQPEEAADVGAWNRTPPLTGTESWLLQVEESGRWRSGNRLAALAPDTEYSFWSEDKNVGHTSHGLFFRGRDLARLRPGEVLVSHFSGPTDAQGYRTPRLAVIRLDQMKHESC